MIEHFFLKHGVKIKKMMLLAIIVLNLIIILSMGITKFATGKATILGYKPFFIMSESMEPTIMTHQFVIAVPIKPEDVKVGDIVTYNLYSTLNKLIKKTIIHRVVAINDDDTFVFKGDNNETEDAPVAASRIGYKIILY